jgi:hypothetical protein
MYKFICENSFEFKLKKNNDISDLKSFLETLPKFKRWVLFTFIYPNETIKKTIVELDNPYKEIKFFERNNIRMLIGIKSEIMEGSLIKVKAEICKQKLF